MLIFSIFNYSFSLLTRVHSWPPRSFSFSMHLAQALSVTKPPLPGCNKCTAAT